MPSTRAIGCVAGLVAAILAAAQTASAHVFPNPTFVADEGTTSVALTVPNERMVPMTGFVLRVPNGLRIEDASSSEDWSVAVSEQAATWTGRRIPPFVETSFEVELAATQEPGTVVVDGVERFADGRSVRWPVTLLVTPADAPSQQLGLALVVGIVGLFVVTLGSALLLRRRRPLQEK